MIYIYVYIYIYRPYIIYSVYIYTYIYHMWDIIWDTIGPSTMWGPLYGRNLKSPVTSSWLQGGRATISAPCGTMMPPEVGNGLKHHSFISQKKNISCVVYMYSTNIYICINITLCIYVYIYNPYVTQMGYLLCLHPPLGSQVDPSCVSHPDLDLGRQRKK